jgi:hypothetical protein
MDQRNRDRQRRDRGRGPRGQQNPGRQQGPVSRPRLNAQQRGELILQGFDAIPRFRYSDLMGITTDLFATSEDLVTRNNNVAYVPGGGRGGAARNASILDRTNSAINRRNIFTRILSPPPALIPQRNAVGAGGAPVILPLAGALIPFNAVAAPVAPTAAQAGILVQNGILNPTDVNTNDTDNDSNNRKADREIFYSQIKNILSYGVGELKDPGSDDQVTTLLANKSDEAVSLYLGEKSNLPVAITAVQLADFKTLSDNFEADADKLEKIAKAIFATSDTDDYADSYDFYANIERLYEQKFEITSLVEDAKNAVSVKLPTTGGALGDVDEALAAATDEKAKEKQEEYSLKLRKLEQDSLLIERKIQEWNGRLARPIVTAVDRRKADEELSKLFTESEKNISGFQAVLDEINSSRTGDWFKYVQEKSDNYVDIAGILFQAKKERVEAEKAQKEATAKFLNASANQQAIDDCLKDMKNVSTAKCDRITQVREIYRRAKEIEEEKNKLVQNAALMLNPSRGVLKYNDSLSDGQRTKLFEDLENDLRNTYEEWVGLKIDDSPLPAIPARRQGGQPLQRVARYPNALPNPVPNALPNATAFYITPAATTPAEQIDINGKIENFKREYDIFFNTYLTKVVSSSANYGDATLPGNKFLKDLTESNEAYKNFKEGRTVITPQQLYETHFRTNTKNAIKIINEQRNLIKLASGGGDLVRQEIDAKKQKTDENTEELMADYEKVKSLPTQIEKSEETTRKCFNEGFDKSKRERDEALKQEIAKFKSDHDSELISVEKEYKENLIKAKNEVKEVQENPRRKEPKDMTPDELEKEYANILSNVQQLDDKIKQNKPEDARRLPDMQNRLAALRTKLAEVGRLRKPKGGFTHSTRRQIMY